MFRWFTSNIQICIVSSLVLAIGVYGTVDMIAALLLGKPEFNPAFLLIWIGLGLLRGSSLQRGLFGGVLALIVVGLVVVFFDLLWPGFSKDPRGSWVGFFLVAGIFFYAFLVLGSGRNDEWFSQKYSGKGPVYVIPVTVVLSAFFAVFSNLADHERDYALSQVFPYDLEIMATDSETGEKLQQVSIGRVGVDFEKLEFPDWMKVISSGASNVEGVSGEISGYARRSFIITIESEGYLGESIQVDRNTPSPLKVSLQPLKKK